MNTPAIKASGMSYLKYLNICSQHVRNSLKEPWRTQAMLRSKTNVIAHFFLPYFIKMNLPYFILI